MVYRTGTSLRVYELKEAVIFVGRMNVTVQWLQCSERAAGALACFEASCNKFSGNEGLIHNAC